MLVGAAIVPIAAAFGIWMPTGQTTALWFQRSGAITTVLSLLSIESLAFGMSQLLPPRGGYGDLYKLEEVPKHAPSAGWLRVMAIIITFLGTLIWGYGDLLLAQ
ncbi:MAG TPA: hypothetical protein DIW53_19635 [Achromobacter sp.]|nr:hypothetical protein [Achromobacter sp.]